MEDTHRKLSWSLMVITYNRAKFLVECLKHALNQTRIPSEIVIVDASDNWQETFDHIKELYAEHWENVRLVYEPAKVRGIPYQRNQALDLTTSDVVFSLDDDIYLWPNAAEVVMEAYDCDKDEEVAMVGGFFVDGLPGEVEPPSDTAEETSTQHLDIKQAVKSKLEGALTLESHFVPYGKEIEYPDLPEGLKGKGYLAGGLINGGRTTFRRKFGVESRWSVLLRYYATHEDSDFSYRLSSYGKIIQAPKAYFFHADGAEDRPFKFKINTIRVRNLMALHRATTKNRFLSAWRLTLSFLFYTFFYLLIDPMRKRFTLPNALSYAYGVIQVPYFLFYPFEDFKKWYVDLQERMYRKR